MSGTAASQATRKQLDELDALLQKMLALPINQLDEPPAQRPPQLVDERPDYSAPADPPPTTAVRPDLPQSAFFSHNTTLPASPPVTVESPTPKTQTSNRPWSIDLNPRQGSSVLGSSSPTAATPVSSPELSPTVRIEPPPNPAPVKFQPIPQAISSFDSEYPVDAGYGRVDWKYWPILGINLVYDWVMPAFGERGRWLCTPAGRNLMGGCGILMLIASLAYGGIDVIRWPR